MIPASDRLPAPTNNTGNAPVTATETRMAPKPQSSAPERPGPNVRLMSRASTVSSGHSQDGYGSDSDGDSGQFEPASTWEHDTMLFDPDIDDDDERWLEGQRQGGHTDALLSCPSCFTLLCIECQQHDSRGNLYRAMFVRNCCLVGADERINVMCEVCRCKVGEYDSNTEVYTFDSALPSEA
jgi:hypothetical protein